MWSPRSPPSPPTCIYTYYATEWRIEIRRKMNDSDTEANTKAIDSLLNYETVKYFSAEEREAQRYDRSMARYENASVKTYTSLAVLNVGQAIIFTAGLTATMLMCVIDIRRGTNTVGDFVHGQFHDDPALPAAELHGHGLSRDQAGGDRHREDVRRAQAQSRGEGHRRAQPLLISQGAVRFENVVFSYDPDRPILKGLSFDVPAGRTVAIVGPSGAGKSTISRLLFRLYDVSGGRILIDGQDIRDGHAGRRCGRRSAWCRRTRCCSTTPSATTSAMAAGTPADAEVEEAAALAQIDAIHPDVAQGLRDRGR